MRGCELALKHRVNENRWHLNQTRVAQWLNGYSKTKIKTKPKGNKARQKINEWPDGEKFESLCVDIGQVKWGRP